MTEKIQRQNAEALTRQKFPLLLEMIRAYEAGDNLTTWESNRFDVDRMLRVAGTSREAVIEYITQNYQRKKGKRHEPASE